MPPIVRVNSNPCIVSIPIAVLLCCLHGYVDIPLDQLWLKVASLPSHLSGHLLILRINYVI